MNPFSFDKVVLSNLKEIPQVVLRVVAKPTSIVDIYLDTDPLVIAAIFAIISSIVCFIVAEVNQNFSQVDRVWSLLPTLYVGHYNAKAYLSGSRVPRLYALLLFSVLWSVRLTWNYARKGGYSKGSEDYRWVTVKSWFPKGTFVLFNATFIAIFQNWLLFMISTPAYLMYLVSGMSKVSAWTDWDTIFLFLLLGLLVVELVSDEKQWEFHKAKELYKRTGKLYRQIGSHSFLFSPQDMERGFCTDGLFNYSRHPNFLAEQAIWTSVYLWACFITGALWNWTLVGAVAYIALFQASTWLTELLSAKKYPKYKEYQKAVSKFIPWPGCTWQAREGNQDKEHRE